jgi:serine/threonine protein kinase
MGKDVFDSDEFTIVRRLGTGARTVIYLATDHGTSQSVALKRAVYERPEDSRIFEQMQTEYKVAKHIDHPYVRKCHRLIKKRNMLRTRELLLSMELFEGQPLEDSPSLSLVDVLLVFRMVASGLNAMHQKGFIHCDIKPNNILIGANGAIKIIDLGQSCKIGTIKPRIQGTPDYIAPEQVRRQRLDQRTDVFNLGATMYWAFTGRNVPTLIPKKTDRVSVIVAKDFPAPHEFHKRIPLGVSKLVTDCVKDEPIGRPANMSHVISRMDLLIHSIFGDKIQRKDNARINADAGEQMQ